MEYKSFQDYVKENYKTKNIDYIAIWRSTFCLEAVGVTDHSQVSQAMSRIHHSKCLFKFEIAFSCVKRVENNHRSQLGEEPLSSLKRIVMEEKLYAEHTPQKL